MKHIQYLSMLIVFVWHQSASIVPLCIGTAMVGSETGPALTVCHKSAPNVYTKISNEPDPILHSPYQMGLVARRITISCVRRGYFGNTANTKSASLSRLCNFSVFLTICASRLKAKYFPSQCETSAYQQALLNN